MCMLWNCDPTQKRNCENCASKFVIFVKLWFSDFELWRSLKNLSCVVRWMDFQKSFNSGRISNTIFFRWNANDDK